MKKFKIFIFLLCEINDKALSELKNHLQNVFDLDVELSSQLVDLSFAYNERRRQYSGEEILRKAEKNKRNTHEKWLIIVDVDLYSTGLNFIFGLANPHSSVSIISLTRLRKQFYDKPDNEKLFIERIKKEATHELGHLFYLEHCSDKKCVMHFSNSLYDTDIKSAYFCERCKNILTNNIKRINKALIYLRGHHLICLHFFTGEGYNKEFVENLYSVIDRAKDEIILVVKGADEICKKCPYLIDNVCKDEKEIAEMDKTALKLLKLKTTDTFLWDEIKEKLPEIFNNWYELYCMPCIYLDVCSKTALFKSLRKVSS